MDLKTYVTGLTVEGRKTFCREADIPESYLSAIISDAESKRKAGAKTIAFMICASDGKLQFDAVRSDLMDEANKHIKKIRSKKNSKRKQAA